ncbi:tripartite tricarboxylate transporter substrate binding protein [Microbispora sp. H11081]|uniref:Bug family tripartite tricarboxylate transporter substrate binding protein n=1 Tax=Microbispora sp. H11081 TaxID=2729107 RepID=UPI001472DB1F|nr:tripartite tricarboxylate transporter substrate-binding protein [Microbispora sp. H11081]
MGVLALTGACGVKAPPRRWEELSLIVPRSPGGCGDGVAAGFKALVEGRGWARAVRISWEAGGGGLGSPVMPRTGLVVADSALLAACALARDPFLVSRAVPLARLAGEWEVLVASPESDYRTFDQFAAALLRDPGRVRVAGGADRGPEQLLLGLTAQGLGADPRLLDYVALGTRAQAVDAVLDGRVALAFGDRREVAPHVRSGRLRPLAVSSGERLPGIDAPTLSESGVRVVFADWTGLVAPRGTPGRDALLDLCRAVTATRGWHNLCEHNDWTPMWLEGDDFRQWLTGEARRTTALLSELGLR